MGNNGKLTKILVILLIILLWGILFFYLSLTLNILEEVEIIEHTITISQEEDNCIIEQIQFIKRDGILLGAIAYPSGQEFTYDGTRLVPYYSNVFDAPLEQIDESKFSKEELNLIKEMK